MSLTEPYAAAEAALNAPTCDERLAAAHVLAEGLASGAIAAVPPTDEVNNHVHTCYSFSPHAPASAAWGALRAGLRAVGIMDHDSVAGIHEMHAAGRTLGIATTGGFEVRVSLVDTPFADRLINGPGLTGIAYIAIHGVPPTQVEACAAFLKPLQVARNARNAAMVERLNVLLAAQGLPAIDLQRDVYEQSKASEGGSITERHILAALATKLMEAFGRGARLADFLEGTLGVSLGGKVRGYLLDATNLHYLYDLLGVLKAHYTDAFFIHPTIEECPDVRQVVAFAESVGAISAYAYLGDVGESPTGDKKAEHFEDVYLDELMDWLHRLGFRALTYMPPRNTPAQLDRIRALCDAHGLMQISGVDINSSRQSFNCPEIRDPKFANLLTNTWALIGHERLAAEDISQGLFGAWAVERYPDLGERLAYYAGVGQQR